MISSRILFIAEGMLGDLLVMTPAIRAMKSTFPRSSISILIFQRRPYLRNPQPTYFNESPTGGAATIFLNNPSVSEILEVDQDSLRRLGWWARTKAEVSIFTRLRRKHFDTVVLAPRDRFVVWAYASGAKIRVGQRRQVYHQLLTHKPDIHKSNEGSIKYYSNLVAAIGAKCDSFETEFFVPPHMEESAKQFLASNGVTDSAKLLAIHPGASANDRIWPPERFATLIDALQSEHGVRVLLCGGLHDHHVLDKVAASTKTSPLIADTGQDITQLAALLKRCSLFIGNNSGPRHLAAAVGTRTLVLLTRNDEREWDPYEDKKRHGILQEHGTCPACPQSICNKVIPTGEEYGSYCMRVTSADTVLAKVREVLQEETFAHPEP